MDPMEQIRQMNQAKRVSLKRPGSKVQEISREVLPDGTTVVYTNRGGKVIIPPLPTDLEWWLRVQRNMTKIAYRIARRVAAEKLAAEEAEKEAAEREAGATTV